MRLVILAAAGLVALTSLAMAQHKHPRDIQMIDAALSSAKITPAQRAEVVKLRNEGEKLHYAGNHGAAETVLEKAKAILKVR
jgi:hypothetical protein